MTNWEEASAGALSDALDDLVRRNNFIYNTDDLGLVDEIVERLYILEDLYK